MRLKKYLKEEHHVEEYLDWEVKGEQLFECHQIYEEKYP